MLRLIRRLFGMAIVAGVLLALWAGYDMLTDAGLVDAPKIATPDTAGNAAHIGRYGMVLIVAVVVILVLRVVLIRRSNTHTGYTRWKD